MKQSSRCFRKIIRMTAGFFICVSGWNEGIPQLFHTDEDPYSARRRIMVEKQIENRGIRDKAVLEAMLTVPRHRFVPDHLRDNAYQDRPLPIGYSQTISQPYIVAYMTELVNLSRKDRVLEVGTGSGYQAAILGQMVDSVWSVEIIPELGNTASRRLQDLGYSNISVSIADGYYGLPEKAPFDAIVVTAAAEHIPPPLIRQLTEGGRMIIPVGHPFFVQTLVLVEKKNGKVVSKDLLPVRFVPLTGKH